MEGSLGKKHLKVAVIHFPPFVVLEKQENDGQIRLKSGIEVYLLQALSQILRFSFEAVTPAEGGFGIQTSNGSWAGIMGMIQRKEADVGLSIALSESRATIADFILPYIFSSVRIGTKYESNIIAKRNIFTQAYSIQIWMILLSCVLFGMVIFQCLCKAAATFVPRAKVKSVYSPIWYIFSTMLLKGSDTDIPASDGCRVFASLWSMSMMIFVSAFTGMLISHVAAPEQSRPLDDVETLVKLVDQNKYYFTVVKSTFCHGVITGSSWKPLRKLANHLSSNADWLSVKHAEALERALTQKCAYIELQVTMEMTARLTNKPQLYYSQDHLGQATAAMVFQKGSSLQNDFNIWTMRMLESGLFKKWKDMTLKEIEGQQIVGSKSPTTSADVQQQLLNMNNLKLVFFLLPFGLGLAALVFVIEITARKSSYLKP